MSADGILVEYEKDSLFGQAAAEHTVNLQVLHKRIRSLSVQAPKAPIVRFFFNKTDEQHMIAFSQAPNQLPLSSDFQAFVKDGCLYAKQPESAAKGHFHGFLCAQ